MRRRRPILPLIAALAAIVLTPSAGAGGDPFGQQAPSNTGLPTITGSVAAAQTLSASTGDWSGVKPSYSFQWARCNSAGAACAPIAGQSGGTYAIPGAD